MELVTEKIEALKAMRRYPKELYYKGDVNLLHETKKVSIVGSRKPNSYAREMTHKLSCKLAAAGLCVVSGGAIGVDAMAHKAAGAKNTIMVAATGLERRYPAVNKELIASIEKEGLVISQFGEGTPSKPYNFVIRNELIVALGEILIVTYADENSGSMHSVSYAQKMGKKVYVLPHRIGESEGTNALLAKGEAEAIYDIDAFVAKISGAQQHSFKESESEFLAYCSKNPSYEEAINRFGSQVFEAELLGEISVKDGKIFRV